MVTDGVFKSNFEGIWTIELIAVDNLPCHLSKSLSSQIGCVCDNSYLNLYQLKGMIDGQALKQPLLVFALVLYDKYFVCETLAMFTHCVFLKLSGSITFIYLHFDSVTRPT
jgi:hypothetical protein